jgi:hypothetical protein
MFNADSLVSENKNNQCWGCLQKTQENACENREACDNWETVGFKFGILGAIARMDAEEFAQHKARSGGTCRDSAALLRRAFVEARKTPPLEIFSCQDLQSEAIFRLSHNGIR